MANEKDQNTQRRLLVDTLKRMESDLSRIYGATYRDVLQIAQVRQAIESGAAFTWDGNPEAARQLEKKLSVLASKTEQVVKNGTSAAWEIANTEGARASIGAAIGQKMNRDQLEETIHKATLNARKQGATAENFYNEPQGGLTISRRVWANVQDSRQELQAIIQSEIAQGHSSEQALQNVKKYLKKPNEIPKYIKDANGNLVLNESWVNHHPGRGVYKSAYQNARRLARTEINMAYRRAEIEGYKNNPLITGYEVKTSGNHENTGGLEICECLAGQYPKTFIFTGWHPQCRCHIVPITLTRDEFRERQKAVKEGKENEWQPKSTITKPPKNYNDWIEANKERIDQSKNLPFFVRDNYKIGRDAKGNLRLTLKEDIAEVKRALNNIQVQAAKPKPTTPQQPEQTPAKIKTPEQRRAEILEKAKERHEARTDEDIIDIHRRWQYRLDMQEDVKKYTPNQLAFFKEFEAKTGIKRGLSMKYEDADHQNANPKFKEDKQYRINCQTCVPAYQLRRWGFNVEATGNTKKSLNEYISYHWTEVWKNDDGTDAKHEDLKTWAINKNYKTMTAKRYMEFLTEKCNEKGAIYQFTLTWKGGKSGHTTIIENRDGKLVYVEPQHDNSPGSGREFYNLEVLLAELSHSLYFGDGILRIDKGVKIDSKYFSMFKKSAN